MPLNGSGSFSPITPNYPAISGTDILASDRNAIDEDIATALSNALYRDGQVAATANIPMGGFKVVNVGAGTAAGDAVNFLQVFTSPTFTNATLAGSALNITATATCTIASALTTITSTNTNLTASAVTVATQAPGNNTTLVANTAFVTAAAFSSALPLQTGNAGKLVNTDGTNASWTTSINATVMRWADGTDATKLLALDLSGITTATTRTITLPDASFTPVGTTLTQDLTLKTLANPTLRDTSDSTKKLDFDFTGITTATTRTVTVADRNIALDTPAMKLLATVTAATSATVDVEGIDGTYDNYLIIADDLTVSIAGTLYARLKLGGSYLSTAIYQFHTHFQGVAGTPATYNQSNASAGTAFIIGQGLAATSTHSQSLTMELCNTADTAIWKHIKSEVRGAGTDPMLATCGGFAKDTGALTGVRFYMSSGNILTGTFRLFGIRNS